MNRDDAIRKTRELIIYDLNGRKGIDIDSFDDDINEEICFQIEEYLTDFAVEIESIVLDRIHGKEGK